MYNELIGKGSSYELKIRGGSTTNGALYLYVGGKSLGYGAATQKLYTGKWYHLALVFDGTQATNNLRMYINGSPDSFGTISLTGSAVPRNSASALRIGASGTSDIVGYNGMIDEVRIYNRALSLAEIQDLYSAVPSNVGPVIALSSTASGNVGQPFPLAATVTDDGLGGGPLTLGWNTIAGPGTAFFDNPTSATTNATCSLSGSFTLRLTANDGSITTFADVLAGITGQTFSSWTGGKGLSGPNAALTACPAGDGVSNLMKYALGLDPNHVCLKPTDGTNPGLPLLGSDALNLTLIYQKDITKTDIGYMVQAGTDMVGWSNSNVTEVVTGTNGTIQTIKASVPKGINSQEFVRLRITK